MRRIATLLAVTLMTACSSQLVGPDGSTTETTALCNASGGNEITFQDEADAQSHLVGRWILCSQPGLSWATEQGDQGGIELHADMTWYMLHWVGTSILTRSDGFQASGTWRFNAPQDLMYMPAKGITLFFGLDYSFVDATMLDSPQKMHWDNGSTYVRIRDNTN